MKNLLLAAMFLSLAACSAHYSPKTSEIEAEQKNIEPSKLEEKPKEVKEMERQMQRNRHLSY